MKEISIYADYGLRNLCKQSVVDHIIKELEFNGESEIILNLSGCLIAYLATSKLIDVIVRHLGTTSGNKTLVIELTSFSPQDLMLEDLFRGSECFEWDRIGNSGNLLQSITDYAQNIGVSLSITQLEKDK